LSLPGLPQGAQRVRTPGKDKPCPYNLTGSTVLYSLGSKEENAMFEPIQLKGEAIC